MPKTVVRLQAPPVPGTENARCTPLMEARHIQRLLFSRCCQEKVTDAALGLLARSWCLVADAIRELRGIPKAGQLRPDLDPVQMAKAVKRMRSRQPIDLAQMSQVFGEPLEVDAKPDQPEPDTPAKGTSDQTAQPPTTDPKEKA